MFDYLEHGSDYLLRVFRVNRICFRTNLNSNWVQTLFTNVFWTPITEEHTKALKRNAFNAEFKTKMLWFFHANMQLDATIALWGRKSVLFARLPLRTLSKFLQLDSFSDILHYSININHFFLMLHQILCIIYEGYVKLTERFSAKIWGKLPGI